MLKKIIPAVFLLVWANISFAQDTRIVVYGEKAEYFYSLSYVSLWEIQHCQN